MKAYFVGTCVNSFDENGKCVVPELPYIDVTNFAYDDENAIRISKSKFMANVSFGFLELKKIASKKSTEFYIGPSGVFMMYYKGIHYFFMP